MYRDIIVNNIFVEYNLELLKIYINYYSNHDF